MSVGSTGYQLLLTLHIVAMVAWMAGIFYLPRLFVYHADAVPDSDKAATFTIMERRLFRAIMTPAMIVTWLAGLSLVYFGGWEDARWLWAKVVLVICMSALHGWLGRQQRAFAERRNHHSSRTYRIVNELPTLLLILIVLLVVVKPF